MAHGKKRHILPAALLTIGLLLVVACCGGGYMVYRNDRNGQLAAFRADVVKAGFTVDTNNSPVAVNIAYKDETKHHPDGSTTTESELDGRTTVAGCVIELEREYVFWQPTENFKFDEVHANNVPDGIDVSEGHNKFTNFTINKPTRQQVYDWLVANRHHFDCVPDDPAFAA